MLKKSSNNINMKISQIEYQIFKNQQNQRVNHSKNKYQNRTHHHYNHNHNNNNKNININNHQSFQENFKIYLRVKPIIIQQEINSLRQTNQNINNNNNNNNNNNKNINNTNINNNNNNNNKSTNQNIQHKIFKIPQQCIKIHSKNLVQIISPYYTSQQERIFNYQQIFNGTVCNSQVFLKTMIVPIQNALQGFNSTVFIYGMTGAGKTYSMFGNPSLNKITNSSTQSDRLQSFNIGQEEGLVDMTLDLMFKKINLKPQIKTHISVSFFQIYNQNIKDLLSQNNMSLNIVQDPNKGMIIIDLKESSVNNQNEAKLVIKQGLQRRAMNATKSNQVSSRSHAILQFSIKRLTASQNQKFTMLQSKFFMIDLAGNQKTGSHEAKRFIQGVNINKSLLTLGKCMNILSQNKKNSFVPFRDSKLTRILKQSLGGNSKTVMIACISSQKKFYQQTLNTLKYSTIAKRIKNKGIKNNTKIITKDQIPLGLVDHQKKQQKPLSISYKTQQQQSNKAFKQNHKVNEHMKIYILGQLLKKYRNCISNHSKLERTIEDLNQAKIQTQNHLKHNNKNSPQSKQYIELKNQIKQLNSLLSQIHYQYKQNQKKMQAQQSKIIMFSVQNDNAQEFMTYFSDKQANKSLNQTKKSNQLLSNHMTPINNIHKSIHKKSHIKSPKISSMYCSLTNKQNKGARNIQSLATKRNNSKKPDLTIDCSLAQQACLKPVPMSDSVNRAAYRQFTMHSIPTKEIVINLDNSNKSLNNKEEFIKKLKEIQKQAKKVSKQQIKKLLEEQDNCQYQLGNIQLSMLRKLKFFQRQKSQRDELSLKKSNSFSNKSVSPLGRAIYSKKMGFRK